MKQYIEFIKERDNQLGKRKIKTLYKGVIIGFYSNLKKAQKLAPIKVSKMKL